MEAIDCQPVTSSIIGSGDGDGSNVRLLLNCTVNEWPPSVNLTSGQYSGPTLRYNMGHLFVTSIVLGLIILATIIGNVFVIAAIVLERNLRNVANYLIASLAVADLLVAALVMPLAVVNEVSAHWFLGREACDAFVIFDVICCTASILHLVAISMDRYWAVSRVDYIHSRSSGRILSMIAVSWSASALISIPPLFGARNPEHDPVYTGVCLISQDWGYTVFSTIGAFYLPMLAMFVIYARIYQMARSRIRKRNFRRPGTGAAGLVVAAAERLRDGAAACSGITQDSPTPLPLIAEKGNNRVFFSSTADDSLQRNQPRAELARSTSAVTAGSSGADEDADTIEDGSCGPCGPSTSSKNGLLTLTSIDDDANGVAAGSTGDGIGTCYSPATAVGNACSIIIAAAAATPQQQQQQQQAKQQQTSVSDAVPTSAASLPFFVRFIDKANWFSSIAAQRRVQHGCRRQQSRESGFVPVHNGSNELDDVSITASASTCGSSIISRQPPPPPPSEGAAAVAVSFRSRVTMAAASHRAREKQEQKRERKATRTLAIVTGTFVGCWLPFFILALVRPFCGDRCQYPHLLVSVIAWLGYVNSLLNPVIYTIFNPDFRTAFRKILFGKYRGAGRTQMHALQHLPFARRGLT